MNAKPEKKTLRRRGKKRRKKEEEKKKKRKKEEKKKRRKEKKKKRNCLFHLASRCKHANVAMLSQDQPTLMPQTPTMDSDHDQ